MRYLPHTEDETKQMLDVIGVSDIADLFTCIPEELKTKTGLDLGNGFCEQDLLTDLKKISSKNRTLDTTPSFIGAGAYHHYIPAAVTELASRSEFVTPYTPYQPEISQGTLQVLFEYQSMITRLFDMDVSNASHYSGATAFADAALMARRVGRKKTKIVVPDSIHPEYREVLKTTLCGENDIINIPSKDGAIDIEALKSSINEEVAAVAVQYPNFFGIAEDMKEIAELTHNAGALLISITPEPLSLALLKPPGSWGADIAVGEGLSFGLPISFGGPTLGIFTCTQKLVRSMPGRICGRTVDVEGRRSYTLTLSTREQHIRREKATSNICSNQALCATTAAIYLSLLGKSGIRELAMINASLASYAKNKFSTISGVKLLHDGSTFNEFAIECTKPAAQVLESLRSKDIVGGADLGRWYPNMKNCILICCTELNSKDDIEKYANALTEILK